MQLLVSLVLSCSMGCLSGLLALRQTAKIPVQTAGSCSELAACMMAWLKYRFCDGRRSEFCQLNFPLAILELVSALCRARSQGLPCSQPSRVTRQASHAPVPFISFVLPAVFLATFKNNRKTSSKCLQCFSQYMDTANMWSHCYGITVIVLNTL